MLRHCFYSVGKCNFHGIGRLIEKLEVVGNRKPPLRQKYLRLTVKKNTFKIPVFNSHRDVVHYQNISQLLPVTYPTHTKKLVEIRCQLLSYPSDRQTDVQRQKHNYPPWQVMTGSDVIQCVESEVGKLSCNSGAL